MRQSPPDRPAFADAARSARRRDASRAAVSEVVRDAAGFEVITSRTYAAELRCTAGIQGRVSPPASARRCRSSRAGRRWASPDRCHASGAGRRHLDTVPGTDGYLHRSDAAAVDFGKRGRAPVDLDLNTPKADPRRLPAQLRYSGETPASVASMQ